MRTGEFVVPKIEYVDGFLNWIGRHGPQHERDEFALPVRGRLG
jgi:hypothetical protein